MAPKERSACAASILSSATSKGIVGRCPGANALAAVGSAYTLMTFITSILIGLALSYALAPHTAWGVLVIW